MCTGTWTRQRRFFSYLASGLNPGLNAKLHRLPERRPVPVQLQCSPSFGIQTTPRPDPTTNYVSIGTLRDQRPQRSRSVKHRALAVTHGITASGNSHRVPGTAHHTEQPVGGLAALTCGLAQLPWRPRCPITGSSGPLDSPWAARSTAPQVRRRACGDRDLGRPAQEERGRDYEKGPGGRRENAAGQLPVQWQARVRNQDSGKKICGGFIAQEAQKVFPRHGGAHGRRGCVTSPWTPPS